MSFKADIFTFFKQRVLKPQLKHMDAWEAKVFNSPDALQGGENSPVRFNIPHEGLKI